MKLLVVLFALVASVAGAQVSEYSHEPYSNRLIEFGVFCMGFDSSLSAIEGKDPTYWPLNKQLPEDEAAVKYITGRMTTEPTENLYIVYNEVVWRTLLSNPTSRPLFLKLIDDHHMMAPGSIPAELLDPKFTPKPFLPPSAPW